MPRPRRHARKPLIDFSGTQKTIDILRNGNVGLHRFQDRIDDEEESAAHDAEVQRRRNEAMLLTVGDPRRTEAERHLDFLTGKPYLAWRKVKLFPRKAWRRVRAELFLAFLIPLQLLLIAVCNVVGFLLLWWLLFGLF
ncbi:MAG: hypothetical protein IPK42_19590 [Betaproteobacteria bacterium]|nr:hypothetical protein [Betaproteobacteria bacterium]